VLFGAEIADRQDPTAISATQKKSPEIQRVVVLAV
jgi:hypothetical protein